MTIKFKKSYRRERGERYSAEIADGVFVEYGWSYLHNHTPFCTNHSDGGAHVFARVQFTADNGNRVVEDRQLFREKTGGTTYSMARIHARSGPLQRAEDAAISFVKEFLSNQEIQHG